MNDNFEILNLGVKVSSTFKKDNNEFGLKI